MHKKLMTLHIRTPDNTSFNLNTEYYPPKYYPPKYYPPKYYPPKQYPPKYYPHPNSIQLRTLYTLCRECIVVVAGFAWLMFVSVRKRSPAAKYTPMHSKIQNTLHNTKYTPIRANALKILHRTDSSKYTSIYPLKRKCSSLHSTNLTTLT